MFLTPTGRLGWDPFADIRRMQQEMSRLYADSEDRQSPAQFPPMNFWVGDDSVVVTVELPGLEEKDVNLTVAEDVLTLQAKQDPIDDPESVTWHRRERLYGTFSRSIELPFRVDSDKVQARFSHGILEIELHRPEADKPKRIQITGK